MAERAIQTFKNHFIAGLSSTNPNFPLHLWDELLEQATITINLLQQSPHKKHLTDDADKNWLGRGEHIATYTNVGKGLLPYIMAPVPDETISEWNELHAQIEMVSNVTVVDIAKTKQKFVVLNTFDKFVKLLQKYINFLHAALGGLCPLWLVLRKMLSALESYSKSAQQSITKTTIAPVLWIILLQSRHFAIGQM